MLLVRRVPIVAIVTLVLALSACSSGSSSKSSGASTTIRPPNDQPTSTVSAAPKRLVATRASWQLPAARAREIVLAGTHALYVVGGQDSGQASTARVWNTTLPDGNTTRLATLPQAVHDAAGVVLGGDILVFGGGEANTIATVQRVHGAAASVTGRMPQARSDLVAAEVNGTAYVLGGFDGTNGVSDILATTDGANFRTVAQLPQSVRYAAVAVVDGRVWLFGGEHDGNNVTTVQVFDPATGTARVAGQLPETLAHASAVVLDGHVLLMGGRHAGRILDSIMQFDPASGAASTVGTLPYAVADAGAAVVDDVAYVVGGETPAVSASVIEVRNA